MLEKQIQKISETYEILKIKLSDPELIKNPKNYKKTVNQYRQYEEMYHLGEEVSISQKKLNDYKEMGKKEKDEEMLKLIQQEREEEEKKLETSQKKLRILLIPKSPDDYKNVVMEIRAGTGGEEASLFAANLFEMYSNFAEKSGWRIEILSSSPSELKGYKEIIFSVFGKNVFENLKFETGVHRVQRIPRTETNGRIHTSTVTVAVFPEAEEEEIEVLDKDLKIDTYRASGAGGQHVNTTDSAIRITHLPTQLVVTCQDERSQIKNKTKAMKILRAKLLELTAASRKTEQDQKRRNQIGTGERSEKIRTYNYPQARISDHRIQVTLYKLENFMQGEIEEILNALKEKDQQERMGRL